MGATISDDEFIKRFSKEGARGLATSLEVRERNVYDRRRRIEKKLDIEIPSPKYAIPDGMKIKGESVLLDQNGEARLTWIKTQQDAARQEELYLQAVKALADDVTPIKKIKAPQKASEHLLAAYVVSDHHLGMYSWAEETNGDYNLDIGEGLLTGAIDHLVDSIEPCDEALVTFLGDLLHYDSFEAITPQNKNILDASGRYPMVVRAAIRCVRYAIEAASRRHKRITVILEIGNHDPSSSIFLMECMKVLYENNPNITINTSPRHYHYYQFGNSLIGVHHGDKVKMDKLPMLMATDRQEAWGESDYRYWWTGHIHHDSSKDFPGCKVESFRVLPPEDAWAANAGYRSMRDMKAIVIHKEFGEVARHIVNPAMLEVK